MSKSIYLFSTSSHPKTININPLNIVHYQVETDYSSYDYLIITSKQVSEYLKKSENKDFLKKPALCVSVKTAQSYESLGGKVLNIGSGYGDNLVETIESYPKDKKWLYLRAKVIASDFVKICKNNGYNIDESIVYESNCSERLKDICINEQDTLIFTSPSSVKCFLLYNEFKNKNKIIVIGNTTAKALPKHIEYRISKETTIESCIDLI